MRAAPRAAASALAAACLLFCARPAVSETLTVELMNGDLVTGEVVEQTDERIVLDHPLFGRLEIPMDQINPRSLNVGIAGTGLLAGWDKEVDLGVSGSEGDTDEADILVGASLEYEDEHKWWVLNARYTLSYADNEIDDDNARMSALRDWLFPGSRWLAFSYSVYDYDDFEAWEHRVTTGFGPGYRIFPETPRLLTIRTGPFITYEFGDEDDARPEYALGAFVRARLGQGLELDARTVHFQTVDESEFRHVTAFELKLPLAVSHGISLKLGVHNEYDSLSSDSKNNLEYRGTFSFDL